MVADALYRLESRLRAAVEEVVEAARAHGEGGDDRSVDDLALDQVDDRIGDEVGVNVEVPALGEEAEHLVRDATQPDLQGRSIIDEPRHVAGEA